MNVEKRLKNAKVNSHPHVRSLNLKPECCYDLCKYQRLHHTVSSHGTSDRHIPPDKVCMLLVGYKIKRVIETQEPLASQEEERADSIKVERVTFRDASRPGRHDHIFPPDDEDRSPVLYIGSYPNVFKLMHFSPGSSSGCQKLMSSTIRSLSPCAKHKWACESTHELLCVGALRRLGSKCYPTCVGKSRHGMEACVAPSGRCCGPRT